MNSSDIERRILCRDVIISRDGERPKIRGYAAVFNQLSDDLGGFREQLVAGAFSDAISNSDVRALVNHDSNIVLGRSRAGTLRLTEDTTGLLVEIDPPDTQHARDLLVLMQRGDVNQMSFAFTVSREDQTWTKDANGPWLRTIKRVHRLHDVSVVTYPAYPQTTAAVRELKHAEDARAMLDEAKARERREREARLRDLDLLSTYRPALIVGHAGNRCDPL